MASTGHLVKRFVFSLRPGGPSATDTEWILQQLLPSEVPLWARMSGPDRRHAAAVARRVERALGVEATRPVLAAALLHDLGKTESALRTYGRVVATLSAKLAGPEAATIWRQQRGIARKVGLYMHHDRLGGDLLEMAGSDPLTVTWAREHHQDESSWTLAPHITAALKAADDD